MRFYNTLSKSKEEFHPLESGKVGMYSCGPTVYSYIHIGNIRAYVFSDTLRRVLESTGYEVRLIKNITDAGHLTNDDIAQGDSGEDKIEKKARAEKKTPEEITLFYEDYFHQTEHTMNILPAQYFPKATAHIAQMIKLIEILIEKGHAYEKNGNVFLDVTTFPNYGKLSGNTLENLKVGARLEEHPDKKNPWDFALWLKAPADHIMHWTSPWSEGYPGWHIECSAMSMEYLGDTLDIHTGGEDNIFPHHEAEIVQSEGVTEKPFVRYWLHTRHILVNGEKMSKSKGNFYTLEDIIEKGFSPMDFRVLLLGAHYRSQMNFTWESLAQAKKNKESILVTMRRINDTALLDDTSSLFDDTNEYKKIGEAMADDLNSPEALSLTLALCRKINLALDQDQTLQVTSLRLIFKKIFFLFGLKEEEQSIPEDITLLAQERNNARLEKNFTESDRLRDLISARGYKVEDTKDSYTLYKM